MEEEASVVCVREIKATPQDHVEEIVVVAETETEKVSVEMLEVFEGVEALENEFLDLQTLGNWRRCWPAQHAYSTFPLFPPNCIYHNHNAWGYLLQGSHSLF